MRFAKGADRYERHAVDRFATKENERELLAIPEPAKAEARARLDLLDRHDAEIMRIEAVLPDLERGIEDGFDAVLSLSQEIANTRATGIADIAEKLALIDSDDPSSPFAEALRQGIFEDIRALSGVTTDA